MSKLPRAMLVLGLAAAAPAALAHPPAILNEAAERAVADEVRAFRKALAEAIAARNGERLRQLHAPSFTYTDPDGRVLDREAHVAAALAGEPMLEAAPVDDLVIRAPNDWVAIASGASALPAKAGGKAIPVRWIAVYTRAGQGWVVAAAQATRVAGAR